MHLLSLLLAFFLTTTVNSLPFGAPRCSINTAAIAKGHLQPSTLANFQISSTSKTYTPNQKISFTLAGRVPPVGLLMYATPGTQPDAEKNGKQHVGSFAVPNGYKAQTASICQAAGITSDKETSTITHSGPLPRFGDLTIEWTAPQAIGPVTINAAVTSGSTPLPWQILSMTLMPAGAGGNETVVMGNGTATALGLD